MGNRKYYSTCTG